MIKFLLLFLSVTTTFWSDLIAHYDFDIVGNNAGVAFSPEVTTGGTNFATVGFRANFDRTKSRLGAGSIALQNSAGTDTAGADGAISDNTFNWGTTGFNSDVRTVAFWVRAAVTQTDANPTMISLGAGAGAGNRFDILLLQTGALRVELQSGGMTTTTRLNDNVWHHVAVVVPNAVSTLADVKYYVDGLLIGNLAGTTAIATGTGRMRMGESYHDNARDFIGSLDDVRLYNEALSDAAIASIYQDTQDNGPQVIFLETDSPYSPPGAARTLSYQLSTSLTSATIDQGVGSVLGATNSVGFGSAVVSPTETTEYTLDSARAAVTAQKKVKIVVSSTPQVLDFTYDPTLTRSRMYVFMPDPTKNYTLTRSSDVAVPFPDIIASFPAPGGLPYREVIDSAAPVGRAFYRLEAAIPPGL